MNNTPQALTIRVESAKETNEGRKRANNEDFSSIFEPNEPDELAYSGCLYIVADGVGGAKRGEKASKYAAEMVNFQYYQHPEITPEERLRSILQNVGNEIFNFAEDNGVGRMATTLVAAALRGDRLCVANVGDSRAYLIRGGQVIQITHDHNQLSELLRSGAMTPEEAVGSRVGNVLTRSIGGHPDVEVDLFPDIQLLAGDLLLMCTDGLHRYLKDDAQLISMISTGAPPDVISKRLVEYANQSGGVDNITALVVAIRSPETTAQPVHDSLPIAKPDPLDVMQTEHGTPKASRKIKKDLARRQRNLLLWGTAVLAVLALMIAAYTLGKQMDTAKLALLNTWSGNRGTTPSAQAANDTTLTKTAVSGEQVVPVKTPAQKIEPTAVVLATDPSIAPQPTAEAQVAAQATASPSAANSDPAVDVSAPLPTPGPKACIYQVKPGEGFIKIFGRFVQDPILPTPTPPPTPYYYYNNCFTDGDKCSGKTLISDPDMIQTGWYLEIPGVSEAACTANGAGGQWMNVDAP